MRPEKQQKKEAALKKQQFSSPGAGKYLQLFSLLVLAAAVGYIVGYSIFHNDRKASRQGLKQMQETEKQAVSAASAAEAGTASMSALSPVERAKLATVAVATPWGTGSGFFISENYIVTNRHQVEFDRKKFDEFVQNVERNRKQLDRAEEKLTEYRARLKKISKTSSRNQLKILISEREDALQELRNEQERDEQRVAEQKQALQEPEIKIILADGSEHSAGQPMISQRYDLALLPLFSHNGVYLNRPPRDLPLRRGDKVYTVGSPVGLRHNHDTVTSGIFSGYRRWTDNQLLLQTNAPISPGNSGGPLVDEHGYVLGVNTTILRDTEGIGFAVPIDKVFDEFASTIQQPSSDSAD
ncbi:MAG: trypsin-like peptidase domain-containing protein [Candidatus Electrothrix sp. YB6]